MQLTWRETSALVWSVEGNSEVTDSPCVAQLLPVKFIQRSFYVSLFAAQIQPQSSPCVYSHSAAREVVVLQCVCVCVDEWCVCVCMLHVLVCV